jgi:hypothetical protein
MRKAVSTSETSANFYMTRRPSIPEEFDLHLHGLIVRPMLKVTQALYDLRKNMQ